MKNPWVVAILNFLTIGLGYVIVGRRTFVGLLLTVAGGILLRYEELRIAPAMTGELSLHWVVSFLGMAVLGVATGIDGYREAQAVRS